MNVSVQNVPEIQPVKRNGRFHLDIPSLTYEQLPTVSICTITYKRHKLFDLAIHNWTQILYPKDKIEWVIVDDTPFPKINLLKPKIDVLKDSRINYIHVPFHIKNLAVKRNYAVGKCKNKIIVNMDDDDYYFKDSVLAKVRALIHYKKKLIFTLPFGVYNLKNNTSQIMNVEKQNVDKQIPEATIAFYKTFWEQQKFKIMKGIGGEGYHLVHQRKEETIRLPFWFNLIVFQHKQNVTRGIRDLKSGKQYANFYNFFEEDVKKIIQKIK